MNLQNQLDSSRTTRILKFLTVLIRDTFCVGVIQRKLSQLVKVNSRKTALSLKNLASQILNQPSNTQDAYYR